ncbi:RING-H2 finger protein ATL16-like [Cynara cardunculus var. scolymus]|uniref:RING-type E3 ubiquitin transferase n=1 Tax=Cynara cardunculus var. scolymus TaxID=59895 RepID=A0A118JWK4_CYNCS|nr:RING-H2 finger protein ATL16-like [Cynara cardunculus var. scolymus]KVH94317.1 Zinc finger, RING/FYVE/PHD-type [Cynara cardunculus var. scolymus]
MDHHHHSFKNQQNSGFPILAIAALCIVATAFLLVTYYFFVTRSCFNWQQVNPLRRFSISRDRSTPDPLSSAYSTPPWRVRGLDEFIIREIPICQYTQTEGKKRSLYECVVCLNDFQELDTLRILPSCNHGFHLDCIDIWLQNNANCPLCRLSISGAPSYPVDQIFAPTSSPQDPQPSPSGSNQDFLIIELGEEGNGNANGSRLQEPRSHSPRRIGRKRLKTRKSHPFSIMGDESIDIRGKDERFSIQPIRRSFSMDSAIDRHIYLSVQEIIQNDGNLQETRNTEEGSISGRTRRHFFSFGHGRGSRSAVLPIEF